MEKKDKRGTVQIDGKTYVLKESPILPPNGNRHVVVVDRGWIFAGDIVEENDRIKLTRAVWVLNWKGIGFDGMIANPKSENVRIREIPNGVNIPFDSEIFRVPVDDSWGL
jgi:hypothetical protein